MALLDDVKVALRLTTDAMDSEVKALIEAAERDMRRVGIPDEAVEGDPLAKMAVVLFCKARFGYDNDEAARFEQSYRQTVIDMRNGGEQYNSRRGRDAVE